MLPSHLTYEDIQKPITPELLKEFDWLDFRRFIHQSFSVDKEDPNFWDEDVRFEMAGRLLDKLPKYKYIAFSSCLFTIQMRYYLPNKAYSKPYLPECYRKGYKPPEESDEIDGQYTLFT